MPSLRSRPGTSAAGSKKPKTTQKNQTRGILENSATVDVDSVEPGNGTTPSQSAKLNEADVPDDREVAARGPELLVDMAAEAVEIINVSSNNDKPDIADHEMVHNPTIEPNGRDIAHNHDSIDAGAATPDSGMAATTADTEDTTCNSQDPELVRPPSNEDEPDIADLERVHNSVESNGRDAAHNHNSIQAGQATIDSKVTAIMPNHGTNSVTSRSTPSDHNPSNQACKTEQQRKRRLSDISKTGHQSDKCKIDHQSGKYKADHLIGECDDTAIVIEEGSPRRPRKICTPRFRDQIDRDNLWMLNTMRRIVKAQRLCDEEDEELDEEQERLDKRKQRMKKLRDLLEGTAEYINSCGAHEQRFSRQLEKEK